MELDDRIVFHTPEGVEVESQLAGLASRFIAGAIDYVIQSVLIVGLILAASAAGSAHGVLVAIALIGTFVISYLYFVPFEVLGAGRSPGKRLAHLRVVRLSGAPVDLPSSLVRNLLRLIDGVTLLFLPTIISVLVTARNQRPGDLVAGTVVIRDRGARHGGSAEAAGAGPAGAGQTPGSATAGSATAAAGATAVGTTAAGTTATLARWETSAVTPQEAAAVRQFLARRDTLDRAARRDLAQRLAGGLQPKVSGAPAGLSPESFLEGLNRRVSGEID